MPQEDQLAHWSECGTDRLGTATPACGPSMKSTGTVRAVFDCLESAGRLKLPGKPENQNPLTVPVTWEAH
jgi:hypothetical protein